MSRLIIILILQLFFFLNASSQINKYFNSYKKEKAFSYGLENEILSAIPSGQLLNQLKLYCADTLYQIRQQAYYLIYKSGQQAQTNDKKEAVKLLLNGCADKNKAIVGRCISYLKRFPVASFDSISKKSLNNLLSDQKLANYKDAYMLAGYANVGFGTIKQQLFKKEEFSNKQLWAMHLALARMGNEESITFCIQKTKEVENENDKIAYLIPDLIYTRQKQAIDYCVEILNSNEKKCYSPNPDTEMKILCAYGVLELIAPIIEDFPYKEGPSGSLRVNDYEEALYGAREWFANNTNYKIIKDKF